MTEAASADTRARIVALARTWLGTPYHHQASVRGAGADCLGLLRGVYAELYGAEPEAPPPYTPSWAEDRGAETLRDAAARHLVALEPAAAEPGDVLLFRWRDWAASRVRPRTARPAGRVRLRPPSRRNGRDADWAW